MTPVRDAAGDNPLRRSGGEPLLSVNGMSKQVGGARALDGLTEVSRLVFARRHLSGRGVGAVYVSHRLDEVFAIAARVVVLRDRRMAGERRVASQRPRNTCC